MVDPLLGHALVSRLLALNDRPEDKVGLLVDLRAVEHGDDPRFALSLDHYLESWLGAGEREVFRLPGPRLLFLAPSGMRTALENGAGALVRVLRHHGFGTLRVTVYDLATEAPRLLEDLLPGTAADRAKALTSATPVPSAALGRLLEVERTLHGADVEPLLREETIWSLADPAAPQPVLTELAISLDELEERLDVSLRRDEWLRHEVASMLDRGLLRHIARDRGRAGRPFAFDLHTATVLEEDFGPLARAIPAEVRRTLTAELASWEAGLSAPRVAAAADRLLELGFSVAVDRVPLEALATLDLAGVEVAYVKAAWTRADTPRAVERLRAGIDRFGADRLVLWHCVAPAALEAGRAAGVALFQGRAADDAARPAAAGVPSVPKARHSAETDSEPAADSFAEPAPAPARPPASPQGRSGFLARLFGWAG